MVRPGKWIPHKLSSRDIIRGHNIFRTYGPDLKSEKTVKEKYQTFLSLNRMTRQEGYEPYVGQLMEAGMAPGTVAVYTKILTRGDKSTEAYIAKKTTEAQHSHLPTSHAPDISVDEANTIIKTAQRLHPTIAGPLWLMLATGDRRVDITRLNKGVCKLMSRGRKKYIQVSFTWTKSIRKIKHRRTVMYPLKDLTDPPPDLVDRLNGNERPACCTVQQLNKGLAKMGYRATTNSFRRLFACRITDYCNETGTPKEELLLHKDKDMDKAFYSWK